MQHDLTPGQCSALGELTQYMRGEIRRLTFEIDLDAPIRSQRRIILALLSSSIVNLEESEPKKLRGYGAMSHEIEARLSHEFQYLIALLEQMTSTVEQE